MFKQTEPIVLASASPRRRRMLAELGLSFEVVPADIDEEPYVGETPVEYAVRAAQEKGLSVATRLVGEGRRPWIVSADTVVVLGSAVLTKPTDAADAAAMLGMLSGRTHVVVTGWAVGRHQGPWSSSHCETKVSFHRLTEAQIAAYVATGEGADKAGAYAIQEVGAFLVDRVEGDYFNVVGLPISKVARALLEVGAITEAVAP